MFLNLFIAGGNGIGKIPLLDEKTHFKGYVYLAFFLGMIIATIVSGLLNEGILFLIQHYPEKIRMLPIMVASACLGVAVFLDLQAKIYTHKD